MVSNISMMIMLFDMMLGLLLPVGMMIYFRKKYKVKYKSFFVGAGVMLVFAMFLEQIIHIYVLNSGIGNVIKNNIWLLSLYGGLMAGLFEEGGRYLAMRFVLKKEQGDPHTALMYGAGHGGFEAFVILTIGMMNNLIYSAVVNSGQSQMVFENLNEEARVLLQESVDTLINTPSWQFMLSPIERIAAISAQIGLSIIIWFAVKEAEKRYKMLLLAFILHMALDFVSSLLSSYNVSVIIIEIVIYILAVGICYLARKIWSKHGSEIENNMQLTVNQ